MPLKDASATAKGAGHFLFCCCETQRDAPQEHTTIDVLKPQSPFVNGLQPGPPYEPDASQSVDLAASTELTSGRRGKSSSRRRAGERSRLTQQEARNSPQMPGAPWEDPLPGSMVQQPACVQICCEEDIRRSRSNEFEVETNDPPEGVLGWVDIEVTVELNKGSRLGVAVRMCGESGGLLVTFVQSGGEIARWNKFHPEASIKAGDCLAYIDGKAVLDSDIHGLCNDSDANAVLTLTFKRPIRLASPIGL
mmetsp:Transcript_34502/g.78765  ORF Transcript_34502/g.78765 Transcript_34502/m.78765 type:complete len:250 (+) Transcript_34502:42-791(+)